MDSALAEVPSTDSYSGNQAAASGASKEENDMTTILLSTMLLLTIFAAFAFGVAMGYWVICGLLNLFHPRRTVGKASSAPVMASTASGD
jgi:hypothetical protein